jgi:hypothetical protein
MKDLYLMGLIAVMGVFAVVSAILVSWPAIAYLASKLA